MRGLSLASVAAEVIAWRKTKQHRTSTLPKEIADHIRELAKSHKTHHIAEKLKMSATTVNKVLQIDQGFRAPPLNGKHELPSKIPKSYRSEEKLALCEDWKRSGMTAEQFCKIKGISKSVLYKWQHKRQASRPSQMNDESQNWVLVKPTSTSESAEKSVSIELTLPNQSIARIKISRVEAVNFFQELYHAIATLR